jgi:hypothetical protein
LNIQSSIQSGVRIPDTKRSNRKMYFIPYTGF